MNLFIDIETIPGPNILSFEEIKIPGNISKPETIAKYQQEHQLDQYKRQALDSMQGRIICIGYQYGDYPVDAGCNDEGVLMLHLEEMLKTAQGDYSDSITFVGWNITTFDIPWLWRKAIQYDLPALRRLIPHGNSKLIIDLMKIWSAEYKDYVSLADCAKFLGIEHEGGNGSEIYDLWQAGDLDSIAEHCRRDVETTMKIYERIMG